MQIPASSIFSEATKSLSIIVPAFNEEKRLPSTLDETLRYVRCGCEGLLSGLRAFIVGMTGLRYKLGRMEIHTFSGMRSSLATCSNLILSPCTQQTEAIKGRTVQIPAEAERCPRSQLHV